MTGTQAYLLGISLGLGIMSFALILYHARRLYLLEKQQRICTNKYLYDCIKILGHRADMLQDRIDVINNTLKIRK